MASRLCVIFIISVIWANLTAKTKHLTRNKKATRHWPMSYLLSRISFLLSQSGVKNELHPIRVKESIIWEIKQNTTRVKNHATTLIKYSCMPLILKRIGNLLFHGINILHMGKRREEEKNSQNDSVKLNFYRLRFLFVSTVSLFFSHTIHPPILPSIRRRMEGLIH